MNFNNTGWKRPATKTKPKINKKWAYLEGIEGALPAYKKGNKKQTSGVAEKEIQGFVESFLNKLGIRFIHIPQSVYAMCGNSGTKDYVKGQISDSFSGVPDILAFKNTDNPIDNSCLLLELKKKNGKQRQNQKKWAEGLCVHVPDTTDKAIEIIKEWIK